MENECVEVLDEDQHLSPQPVKTKYVTLTREGACLETSEVSTGPAGGRTRGGMSLHVASDSASAFAARSTEGEEAELRKDSSILGVDGRDMFG